MNGMRDVVELVRMANPVADPARLEVPATLVAAIVSAPPASTPRRRRKPMAVMAAALLVVGATAAWAYTRSGVFPEPAFEGNGWRLTVGEERNGADGSTYKVCYSFQPRVGANDANGFGVSGCGDWPAPGSGTVLIDAVPVLKEADGSTVVFVDLTTARVAEVSVAPDRGPTVTVRPFRMPESGKQFAVAVLHPSARRATVRLLDASGEAIEERRIGSLAVDRRA